MNIRAGMCAVAVLAATIGSNPSAAAQSPPHDPAALRTNIERRFDILPLRDGMALRPKAGSSSARSIEIAGGVIAVDGRPVTGAELRDRLGADADLVLSLSYLSENERRALIESNATE